MMNIQDQPENNIPQGSQIKSLRELVDLVSGRTVRVTDNAEEMGLTENNPFPFLGIVGQSELKLALLLGLINPLIGGVLLIGPRGTGKTTAVRSLVELMPEIQRSRCYYGCTEEDIENGGLDAVCPDCAKKYGEGEPLTRLEKAQLLELPLNSNLSDVIGGIDERNLNNFRLRIKRGILAHAHKNILYVDEINLLKDEITDAILDAAAMGRYTVRRGPITASYLSQFLLIGSMNPEEGNIRPQILDRFGLRVYVRGLEKPEERLEAYHRVHAFRTNPSYANSQYRNETKLARLEIIETQKLLKKVSIPDEVALKGINLIQSLKIDSLRAEITLFEAAKAYAAADSRTEVTTADLTIIAPLAIRLRKSAFIDHYFLEKETETDEINLMVNKYLKAPER